MWSTVGAHEENGKYAVLGARMGTWMANCTDWDYVEVRDFEILRDLYSQKVAVIEDIDLTIQDLGDKIKYSLGLDWPFLTSQQSKYTLDLYDETIRLNATYYQQCTI
jgi:hypothetical protein